MTVVLHSGIRKNGGTRISVPSAPRSSADEALSSADEALSDGVDTSVPCPAFNRFWMSPASVQRVFVLQAVCLGETAAHQLACRFISMLRDKAIDVPQALPSCACACPCVAPVSETGDVCEMCRHGSHWTLEKQK